MSFGKNGTVLTASSAFVPVVPAVQLTESELGCSERKLCYLVLEVQNNHRLIYDYPRYSVARSVGIKVGVVPICLTASTDGKAECSQHTFLGGSFVFCDGIEDGGHRTGRTEVCLDGTDITITDDRNLGTVCIGYDLRRRIHRHRRTGVIVDLGSATELDRGGYVPPCLFHNNGTDSVKVILQVGGLGGLIGLADKQRHLPEILIGVIPSVARGSTMRVARTALRVIVGKCSNRKS